MNLWRRSLVCCLVVLAMAVGGAFAVSAEDGIYGGTLRVAVSSSLPTLDWMSTTASNVRLVGYHIWENLLTFDNNFNVIGQLASSWEPNADYTAYTFYLRKGVQFHRGYGEMTAVDVKASYDRYLEKAPAGASLGIEAVNIIDDYTIELALTAPAGPAFLSTIASPLQPLIIFPKELMDPMPEIGDIGLENAVGTGPFEMTEWIPGEKIVLSRFEDYAPPGFPATGLGGDRIPYLDEVIIIPMPEETARVAALEAGDVDFAEQLPLTAYRQLVSNPAINPYKVSPYIVPQLYLNLARAPFDDKAMRLAVIEAIDTEELMSAGTRGFDEFYELNCGCIWFQEAQPTLWSGLGCDLGMYDRPANTQKAQDMALAAGYNGEPIRILGYTSYYYNYAMALVLANQLGMAGFNTELEILDSPGYRARRAGLDNWDIAISGASVRFDPNFNYSYFYDLKGWNYFKEGEAEWPEMRALVEQDKAALTQADRDQIWDAMTELFIREATMVNVGELSALEAAGSNVHYEQWYQWSFWNVWFEN